MRDPGARATAMRRCVRASSRRPSRFSACPPPRPPPPPRGGGGGGGGAGAGGGAEGVGGGLDLAAVVVSPRERLEDRALARLEPPGPFEDDRRLGMMATLEEEEAALKQAIGGLALGQFGQQRLIGGCGRGLFVGDAHPPIVPRPVEPVRRRGGGAGSSCARGPRPSGGGAGSTSRRGYGRAWRWGGHRSP